MRAVAMAAVGAPFDATLFAAMLVRLQHALVTLPDKPDESADSTLRALWHAAAGAPVSAARAADLPLPDLDAERRETLEQLVERRLQGEPLAHLTRRQRFLELELLAGSGALVPRAETELLAREAIALAAARCAVAGFVRVIDACTGSGNVALALAHAVPQARVMGADVSQRAVALARDNARLLELDDRVEFRIGDLLAPFDSPDAVGTIDLVTCNPPYISSAKVTQLPAEISGHEPRLALDGGPLGVSLLVRLLQDAPRMLCRGGWLAVEIGRGQGPALARRMRWGAIWTEVREITDPHGDVRVLLAQRT